MWPDIELVGCRFHLRQARYRQIQKLGLQSAYQKVKGKDEEIIISAQVRWLRYAYLDPQEVHDAFISDLITYSSSMLKTGIPSHQLYK